MSTPYLDTNRCAQHFHYFKRTDKGIEPFHSDDQICATVEYFLPMDDVSYDNETRCRECGSTEAGSCFYCKAD